MARILDPLTCGFAKVFMYELFTNRFGILQTRNWKENANKRRFEKLCLRFKDTDKSFYKGFVDKGPGIIDRIRLLGKNSKTPKAGVLKCFSTESLEKLSTEKKKNTLSTTVTNVCAITSSRNILNKFLLEINTTNVRLSTKTLKMQKKMH